MVAGVNPKDLLGSKKVSITKLPAVAIFHGAHALMDGARKYGPFNWREKPVVASIYVDACMRHLTCWFEGQEKASDSGVHHLGHAIACCAILLDAQAMGCLSDDRPVNDSNRCKAIEVLETLNEQIKALYAKNSEQRQEEDKQSSSDIRYTLGLQVGSVSS